MANWPGDHIADIDRNFSTVLLNDLLNYKTKHKHALRVANSTIISIA